MSDRVTFNTSSEPSVVDEIVMTNTDVHIEQMSKSSYWIRIGDHVFWANAFKGGQLKITKEPA